MYTFNFDGLDGVGKSTIIDNLKSKPNFDEGKKVKLNDRSIVTKLTDVFDLPKKITEDENEYFIILDADIKTCMERIKKRGGKPDEFETEESLFKYQNRYRRLAVKYGLLFLDTTHKSIEEVTTDVLTMINNVLSANSNAKYILPNPDNFCEEKFNKLPLVAEGESKVIRKVDEKFNLVSYKPTVYSHKQQRAGVVKSTDKARMRMTRSILYLFDGEYVLHSYWYVGENYVLCEKLDPEWDIPPIEVIVKKCFVGTDKHRYYDLDKKLDRWGKPVVSNYRSEYKNYIVRFDYRNPNHHPTSGKPIGDEVMCDDLANVHIDVDNAKKLAKKTFGVLDKHCKIMGIYLEDLCLMITRDGLKNYSEVSPDCGRYKKDDESGLSDLDKDIWRSGGSSELVKEKWDQMATIVEDYVKSIYSIPGQKKLQAS